MTGLLGTAVNVQSMVYGNLNDQSGTGVCFTRNPSNGKSAPAPAAALAWLQRWSGSSSSICRPSRAALCAKPPPPPSCMRPDASCWLGGGGAREGEGVAMPVLVRVLLLCAGAGTKELYGEYLQNAQGEDVVAGEWPARCAYAVLILYTVLWKKFARGKLVRGAEENLWEMLITARPRGAPLAPTAN